MVAAVEATSERILEVAEKLVQARGFGGFSYADIAKQLGIRKASIHYHFAAKADLGRALVQRYHARFSNALHSIEAHGGAVEKLERYAALYADVLSDGNRMCLCGILAADANTLPKAIRKDLRAFFDDNETWLARVLEEGRRAGELRFTGKAEDEARYLVSSLEGAMLVARPYAEVGRFRAIAKRLFAGLAAAPADKPARSARRKKTKTSASARARR